MFLPFSTKQRARFIPPEIEGRVWAYIGGIAKNQKMSAIQVSGIEDYIHALVMAKPSWGPSNIAKPLKGESSKWMHEEFADMRKFGWQEGMTFSW
jgi:REP element-mobilizing transposase RayT